ncbi:MAG: IS110 family transposase, partial [Terriglobales bacterium]
AAARDASHQIVWRERLDHVDRNGLRKRVSHWPAGTPVILEGTFGWGWMSDELSAARLDPHLSSSRKVAGWREARGIAKNNKIDADLLSELWDQKPELRHGELKRWWEVWLAPQEVRDQRELLRHRMSLVKMQTETKNRVHALLHRHGIVSEFSDLFGVAGRRFLSLLMNDPQRLRETGRQTLKDQLILLDQLRRLIARATRQFRQQLARSKPGQRLMTLPGISTVLAYTIIAEIGKIERFRKSRSLARYSLLAPQADDSGEEREGKPIGRKIGHAGRHTLQWAWIEAARGAVRKDAYFRAIFNRRTDNGKKDRNRGYITVANVMCKIGHAMLSKGTDYQEVAPRRPGTRRNHTDFSHPGTGQPYHPMVTCDQADAREASL